MDPKATAKSKRSHTQQGRKNHPAPAAIAQKKKAAAPQSGKEEKPRQARYSRGLPSNWDRYDDAAEGADDDAVGTSLSTGEVVPKSKGADFEHLIEEARSQRAERRQGSAAFDELSLDFMQGVSSMLSVRGKSLSSWCEDENFIVDDDTTSSYEVPFLSMDLHALAAQLSKLKLSQRLFIEADLLPEEAGMDESKKNPVAEQAIPTEINETKLGSSSTVFTNLPAPEKNANDSFGVANDKMTRIEDVGGTDQPQTSRAQATRVEQSECLKPQAQAHSSVKKSVLQVGDHAISDFGWNNASRLGAQAELDMLLDSFSGVDLSGSTTDGLMNTSSAPKVSGSGSLPPIDFPSFAKDPASSRNIATASIGSIEDSMDDLLAETVLNLKDNKHTTNKHKQGASKVTLPPQSSLGSGSPGGRTRHVTMTAALDDTIDDLLAETSACLSDQKKPTALPRKEEATSSSAGLPSSTSGLRTDPMDDFDSWMDTL